ncbi:hypothetical protein [Streptomyces stelliscabiei]|uniref:Uncharacterized protein n=1 Tax=Streptomyces stelliscabiei TaxID=146820 RepID=A0A8I0TWE9_9ACTN|nr:hypothetical protein [Streptomyces stelliscabiei]MBE1602917.1 hypothetical protein [Streptomyces stelliscabiei]MDX2521748.1 hypothetical protein [Streptomyces stelliscabiei]
MLDEMTEEFGRKHGFPPGTNRVRLARHDDQEIARALGSDGRAAADLVTFYGSIAEVVWEDVGNGYVLVLTPSVVRFPRHAGGADQLVRRG